MPTLPELSALLRDGKALSEQKHNEGATSALQKTGLSWLDNSIRDCEGYLRRVTLGGGLPRGMYEDIGIGRSLWEAIHAVRKEYGDEV